MFKNIIFDFDGVVIHSHDVQLKALTESYKEICGEGTPPINEFFKLSGDSLKNIFMQLDLPLEMIPIYQRISRENIGLIRIHEGMLELLEHLNEIGCVCALCTGKDRDRTVEILQYFNMKHLFKTLVCSDDVVHPKPHPESLLTIMTKLNALPKNTVMVGDGINDIIAAKNAYIQSVAVTWGDVAEQDLKNNSPDYVCNSIAEIRELVLKDVVD